MLSAAIDLRFTAETKPMLFPQGWQEAKNTHFYPGFIIYFPAILIFGSKKIVLLSSKATDLELCHTTGIQVGTGHSRGQALRNTTKHICPSGEWSHKVLNQPPQTRGIQP